ncbi:MAG: sulfurtransferase [Comamonadaceae bacterium]|nr:sulfurtransferase [Comamonadaceae bacterium]RRD56552.1 sulfurtransferase [Comamonadaceae bacterium OH2545_COT-014]
MPTAPYTTLISPAQLQALQASGAPLMVFDCSFDLTQPAQADALFTACHITGSQQAHLDRDLSAHVPAEAVNGGRHPLPTREHFAAWLGRTGFGNGMQAVVYDRNGCNYCGRLWWMLKWAGHDAVAVLDGGLAAWQAAGGATESGPARPHPPTTFTLGQPLRRLVLQSEVIAQLESPAQTLIDARGAPRYRGDTEPLDPVAGHIPGALNRPFTDNFTADGRFKPAHQLQAEFNALLAGRDPASAVHHCGSGVSAIPNVLAMELAGFGPGALYAGSWSEWSRTPGLPVQKG